VKSEVRGPRESHSRGAIASSSLVTRSILRKHPGQSALAGMLFCELAASTCARTART